MKLLAILRAIHQSCEIKCRDLNKGFFLTKKDLFSTIQFNACTSNHDAIAELKNQVKEYSCNDIPFLFVERFLIGTIADVLIEEYSINQSEAFVLGMVILGIKDLSILNLKLGISGTIAKGMMIRGNRIDSTEEIADFVFDNLNKSEFTYSTDSGKVYPGPALNLMEVFP